MAKFIRKNRNPPIQKNKVGYFPVKTTEGTIEMTPIEREMYRRLTGAGLNPRCQFPVGPYRLDFAFLDEKVGIEVDGSRWHQDREKDEFRDRELEVMGWGIIRIRGSDAVRKDARTILGPIFSALGRKYVTPPIRPLGGIGRWDRHYSIAAYYRSKEGRR